MKDNVASPSGYFGESDCDLAVFAALCEQTPHPQGLTFAAGIEAAVPYYDMAALDVVLAGPQRAALLSEWAHVLGRSSGALVLKRALPETGPLDAATAIYHRIIAEEAGQGGGDHFARAGSNARIWNALQKLCLRAPEVFTAYFGNPAVTAVAEAWLGPGFQMTAQINLVRPGGAAQDAHRDYHLGFQSAEEAARFPAHIHALSPALTLQGGIAHVNMPVETGPTKLLPFSQLFGPGYLAFHQPAFRAYFEAHHIQLPLQKGDALFFNPALFHAAGENRSAETERMVNLLQISSAFGRAMENVDRNAMSAAVFPALKAAKASGMPPAQLAAAIACTAEGYAFPTNLDTDPPAGSTAPPSQQALLIRALAEGWPQDRLEAALSEQAARRRA